MGVQGKRIDMVGQKFGKLTVVAYDKTIKGIPYWNCICECGNTKSIARGHLVNKKIPTSSCGCIQKEYARNRTRTHGDSSRGNVSEEFKTWLRIKERCFNPKCRAYKDYMGRGITMSEEWKDSYETFLNDMGRKPSHKHSIDRIDNNGNYCKENCRWATIKEQNNNQRKNVYISIGDKTKTVAQWAEELNKNPKTIYNRLYNGWSAEDAVLKPVISINK